jgi:3-hydroxyisobutyrate dehydrogenase-like beta-hydroxyacid dehydrogenase
VRLGVLHPGAMGVTIAQALKASGHDVQWLSEGRGEETIRRASAADLTPVATLGELVRSCEGLISVCPPHAAVELAGSVHEAGFRGFYLDANAVAPATARAIHQLLGDAFVDGGIIGPPALKPGTTRLYLAGQEARTVADWFSDDVLGVHLVPGAAGAASALKMCYAAYTKGSSALLLAIRALAEAEGVSSTLLEEWERSQPQLKARSDGAARGTAAKAWRFVGEMEEIAATFQARGLPGEFHLAAADIYQRMNELKTVVDPDLATVLEAILQAEAQPD